MLPTPHQCVERFLCYNCLAKSFLTHFPESYTICSLLIYIHCVGIFLPHFGKSDGDHYLKESKFFVLNCSWFSAVED